MLQQKAGYFAQKIGHGNFKATEGCISHWEDRNNIKFKRFHEEKASADRNGADEWSLSKLPEIPKRFIPKTFIMPTKLAYLTERLRLVLCATNKMICAK